MAADPEDERLGERVSAACYGTVLVLSALALVDADNVSSGVGWELVTTVGVATWLAHLYAEAVGDHLRHRAAQGGRELRRAMVDGVPILLATVPPALMLFLGRLDVLDPRAALWASVVVAVLQLAGVGAFVGWKLSSHGSRAWTYAAATAAVGLAVVTLKATLGH